MAISNFIYDGLPWASKYHCVSRGPNVSIAYSPNGDNIISKADDNTIRIWDAKSLKPMLTVQTSSDNNSVMFCIIDQILCIIQCIWKRL